MRYFKMGLIKATTEHNNKSGISRNNAVTPTELEAGTYNYNSNSGTGNICLISMST